MSDPVVSIIIPTYNRAKVIEKALRSALAQTYTDTEIIVADDGSRDQTAEVVAGLAEPRIRFVRKENGGCSSARNFGVSAARGRYVAFLDSDDEWDTHWLEAAIAALEADMRVGAVYGSLERIDENGRTFAILDLSLGGRHDEATVEYVLSQCQGLLGSNVVARTQAVKDIGGWDETFPTSGDLDFGLRLACHSTVKLVATPMIRLVETSGSLSKKVNTGNRLRVLDNFESRHPDLAKRHAGILRSSRARILRSYGEDLLWLHRIDEAKIQLRKSLDMQFTSNALWLLLKARARNWIPGG
jgi:glycosyltransferase involved in cell wall biosynthesis